MPCEGDYDRNSFQPWARVRDGSVFTLSVATAGAGVVSGARVLIDHPDGTTEERLWKHEDLVPGPASLTLEASRRYAIRVTVAFTTDEEEEAVIAAEITKPNDSRHGRPYRYCVHGTREQTGRSTITIATRSA